MEFKLHVCDVCKLLDNDFTIKECFFCDGCQAWICKQDKNKIGRRSKAMLLRKARQYGMALITLIILAGLLTGKSEAQYYARTDTNTVQLPAYPPALGHLIGAGTRWVDPDFKTELIRATDANTDPNHPNRTFITSASAQQQIWFKDNRRLIVTENGNLQFVLIFDPVLKTIKKLNGFTFSGPYSPSRVSANVLYTINNTILMKWTFPSINSTPVGVQLFDFASCLPAGFDPYWDSMLTVSNGDGTFLVSYSEGTQNTGYMVLAFKPGKGCRTWNTLTGDTKGWGITGKVTNADRFTSIHNVQLDKSGNWAVVDHEECTTASCSNGPYFWNIPNRTVNVQLVNIGGHADTGMGKYFSGIAPTVFSIRPFAAPNNVTKIPLAGAPSGITPPFDKHFSWTNVDALNSRPIIWSVESTTTPFPAAWYNEINASKIDGSVTWRFTHTFSDPNHQRFATSAAITNVSMDGGWAAVSTSGMNSFGSELGTINCNAGVDCRGDVVIVNLKTAGKVFK